MNRIIRNITTVMASIVVLTCLSEATFAQTGCKVDLAGEAVKGEFSINAIKVAVKGDGGGSLTAANNIAVKICEGEIITLKNTLQVSASTSNSYWILKESNYWSNSASIQSGIPDGSYPSASGDFNVKLIEKSVDPNGFSFYDGPGRYVIIQYDNTTALAGGGGVHYACQVIDIIKPEVPVVTTSVCSGSEVKFTFAADPKNNYDDYEITFEPVAGINVYRFKTGKPTTYPFTVGSGNTLPNADDRIFTIKGQSITGNCPSPPTTNTRISFNGITIFQPRVSYVEGTTKKGEFKLAVSAQKDIGRNLYIRDPLTGAYDYTKIFKTFPSSPTATTDSIILQVPDGNKAFCFQAESIDNKCPATTSNPLYRSSEEICTTPANVKPESNKNVISWLQAINPVLGGAFSFYQVERLNPNGSVDKLFPKITTATDLKVEDPDVVCGTEYTYRVLTNYSQESYSNIIKVRAISNDVPTKIPKFFATMTADNKNVYLQGEFNKGNIPTDIKPNGYNYYRGNSLGDAFSLIKTDNSVYQDLSADANKQQYCYYLTWTNLCNKESTPSDKVCTVFLKSSGATVNWTREKPHTVNTDSYIVQKIDNSTGNNIKELASNLQGVNSFNTTTLPETEGQEIYIQIETRPVGWNTSDPNRLPNTLSNVIKIFRPSLMMSPQIFTPNGDNNNDKFMIRGKFIKSMKMTIYDRWGNAIFYDEQLSFPIEANQNEGTVVGWDGMMNNGNKALEGSYAFKIEIEDTIGQITYKEGALLLAY